MRFMGPALPGTSLPHSCFRSRRFCRMRGNAKKPRLAPPAVAQTKTLTKRSGLSQAQSVHMHHLTRPSIPQIALHCQQVPLGIAGINYQQGNQTQNRTITHQIQSTTVYSLPRCTSSGAHNVSSGVDRDARYVISRLNGLHRLEIELWAERPSDNTARVVASWREG